MEYQKLVSGTHDRPAACHVHSNGSCADARRRATAAGGLRPVAVLYSVEQWRDEITSMDEDALSIWMMDSEKFLHYVEVPHGYTLDQAHAHHRDKVLRPLLDALLSSPATPVRQRLINDLRQFHFEDEWQWEQSTRG